MDDFTDALDISVLSSLLSRPRVSLHPVIQKPWLKFFREKIRRIMMSSISSKGKITYCNRNICRTSTTKQVLGNCERMVMANLIRNIQGVPKKRIFLDFGNNTTLETARKKKNSGNSLCDRHHNFPIWPFRSRENCVQRWQPYLKILDKNGEIFFRI